MKKILFVIQTLLTLACLVLVIIYFAGNKSVLTALEITTGVDLIFMGINTYVLRKSIKYSILYFIVGIIMIMTVVLSMLGVI